ncbi:MAG: cohesin domain-containing protein [Methanomicrobiales archaeon]|nr:cohesin domain-containing protein [Methanomicrobiales archaeon]
MSSHQILICLLVIVAIASVIPSSSAAGEGVLRAGNACGPAGTRVSIPITLSSLKAPVGNMDLAISYDPVLVRAVQVNRGELSYGAIFDSNIRDGEIRIGIASTKGIEGSGAIAYIVFEITGARGISRRGISRIHFSDISANHAITMDTLRVEGKDGAVEVLPGIRFETEGNVQQIIVNRDEIDGRTRIEGDWIRCDQCGLNVNIGLRDVKEQAGRIQGVVNEVRIISTPVAAELSFGRVEAWFEFSMPRYPTEGHYSLLFSEEIDPALQQSLEAVAGRKGLEIQTIPFLARIEHGYGKTGPATGHFTVPETLVNSMGGIQNLWFGHQSEQVAPELLKAEFESGPDPSGQITLKVNSPEGLSIFALASARVKSMAGQESSGGASQSSPQTGLTLFFNMIVSAATLSTGNLVVGAIVIFLLVGIIVAGIFYVQRKRGI